jgi:hypothetical protein
MTDLAILCAAVGGFAIGFLFRGWFDAAFKKR